MKPFPDHLVPYKRTAEFMDTSVPSGLLHAHRTKEGVWGKIVILEGSLLYRILEPVREEIQLTPDRYGVVEPTITHEVVPQAGVRFYVEFYHEAAAEGCNNQQV
jgi:tellurite resistance-related uncharacterized protein